MEVAATHPAPMREGAVKVARAAAAATEAIGQETAVMEATVVDVAATVVPPVVAMAGVLSASAMAGEAFIMSPLEENASASREAPSEALAGMAAAAETVTDFGTEPPSGEVLVGQAATRVNPAELEVEAQASTKEAMQRAYAEAPLEGAVVADGRKENSCPPGPMSSGGAVMVLRGEDVARLEDRSAEAGREMTLPPRLAGLLSSAHEAVDRLAQGHMREKTEVDREHLLLAGAWREVQEARATTASERLRVAEETRRLEERGSDHASDLEARLSSAEEKLARLDGELGAARAKVLELKEGHNVALVAVAQAGKERDDAVAVITQARGGI